MSLLAQYEALKGLSGFTLGFYKFFDAFQYTEGHNFKWNEIVMWHGWSAKISDTEYAVYPNTGLYSVAPYSQIRDIVNFAESQKTWIQSAEAQAEFKRSRRAFKEECQRRINFFVAAIHKLWAGAAMRGTGKTWDPYLRDIRNMAFLCLRD